MDAHHVDSPADDLAGAPVTDPERRMSPAEYGFVIASVLFAAFGQLMLRRGMVLAQKAVDERGANLLTTAATSPWIIVGLAIFGFSAVLWMGALRTVPLSRAYPFNGLSYVVILVVSYFAAHEKVTWQRGAGSALVFAGLLLVVRS